MPISYLLPSEYELIASFFREVFLSQEMLAAFVCILCAILLFLRDAFVEVILEEKEKFTRLDLGKNQFNEPERCPTRTKT